MGFRFRESLKVLPSFGVTLGTPAALLATALAAALLAAAQPLAAQGKAPGEEQPPLASCTYAECALRVESHGVFGARPEVLRGAEGRRVARFGVFGPPDLARIVAGVDSAVTHARAFRPRQRRASMAGFLSGVTAIGAVVVGIASDNSDVSRPLGIAAAVLGVYAGYESRRAEQELSRAVWWYNRAIPR